MLIFGWRGSPRRIIAVGLFLIVCVLVRNLKTSHMRELKKFVETEEYSDAATQRGSELVVQRPTAPRESTTGYKRYAEIEPLYRQVESDIHNTRQYSLALLRQIGAQIPGSPWDLPGLMEDVKHRFSVAQHDLWQFRNESGLIEWQREEVEALGDQIQHRIRALQNPEDCESAKKILCNIPVAPKARGTGSQLHHLSYCFLAAYGTQRTLVINKRETSVMDLDLEAYFLPLSENCAKTTTQEVAHWPGTEDALVVQFPDTDRPVPRPNYLPRSVPRDFAERLASFHGDPFAWWMGQFMKYAMRMNRGFQEAVEKLGARLGFEGPIVGVQVRRTDKLLHDSRLIELEEYMEAVDDFYNDLEVRGTTVTTRKVYLATDDPQVLKEAKEKFPKHAFVYNEDSVASANMKERRSEANIHNILADVYFLSRSDFLVCGMSSNTPPERSSPSTHLIGSTTRAATRWRRGSPTRLAEKTLLISPSPFPPSPKKQKLTPPLKHPPLPHLTLSLLPRPLRDSEIELQRGDRVKEVLRHYSNHRNLHDGFIHGVNQRTRKAGLYPIYKTVDVLRLADTPPFDAIDRRDK
ncbi:Alpha-(1,6)-fucosyltransferase [Penaeus vannamei]|uniref:Alpha-(1,6)-fucosyltransferase n=1 Tax=Penaeus vannamei TaxID=6689 RepID=A0A3R7M3I7_PENVA|nr:Alpha-(1,6)-fucosyltransferase [Penaeus vannamei]